MRPEGYCCLRSFDMSKVYLKVTNMREMMGQTGLDDESQI